MTEHLLFTKPEGLKCEAKIPVKSNGIPTNMRMECGLPAVSVYGPECEAETGKLMYLCQGHTEMMADWKAANAFNPVECPTHGRIGMVKDYLILKRMETVNL